MAITQSIITATALSTCLKHQTAVAAIGRWLSADTPLSMLEENRQRFGKSLVRHSASAVRLNGVVFSDGGILPVMRVVNTSISTSVQNHARIVTPRNNGSF